MANNYGVFLFLMVMVLGSTTAKLEEKVEHAHGCSFDAIYQFGDSLSDVGNLIREPGFEHGRFSVIDHLPYGETYFHKATGRCSNGLLIIDFLAKALELPFLNPYLERNASSFAHGVDFSVAGATALDFSFFGNRSLVLPITNSSLSVQLEWFKSHLASLCNTSEECKKKLENALFMMGEVGGNDYNFAFFQGKTINEVKTYVPYVVQRIVDAVERVIEVGAKRVVVPGNFPIGCLPAYLTAFQRNKDNSTSSSNGCLKSFNCFAKYHNRHLFQAIKKLRKQHTGVVIVYADYYHNFLSLHKHAPELGFEQESLLKACCGTGGNYNFNPMRMCGSEGVSACADPDRFVSWDGVHLTQKAYGYIAEQLIAQLSPSMEC